MKLIYDKSGLLELVRVSLSNLFVEKFQVKSLNKRGDMRARLRAKVSKKKRGNEQLVEEVIAEAKDILKKAAPVDNDPTMAANEIPTSPNPDKEALLAAVELARADPCNPALRPYSHGDHQRQARTQLEDEVFDGLIQVLDSSPWLHPAVENSGMSCAVQTLKVADIHRVALKCNDKEDCWSNHNGLP